MSINVLLKILKKKWSQIPVLDKNTILEKPLTFSPNQKGSYLIANAEGYSKKRIIIKQYDKTFFTFLK